MKKIVKSIFAITAILCFMVSAAFAAPQDELDALMKDMNKVNNGKVNVEITGKFMDDTFNILAKLDFESKPTTLIRGESELTVFEKGDVKKAKKTSYEFYAEDEGKQYTYYYTEKGKNKWYKDSISNDDKKTEKDAIEEAVGKIDSKTLNDLINKVEYDADFMSITGRGDNVGYKVTMDIGKLMEVVSTVAMDGAKKEEAENLKTFAEVVKNLPPIHYTIIGDTKKREIVAVNMPLTDFLKGSGNAIASNDKIEPMIKVLALMALSDSELTINAEGKDYNKVKVTKLSDNIKKKAQQAEHEKTTKK